MSMEYEFCYLDSSIYFCTRLLLILRIIGGQYRRARSAGACGRSRDTGFAPQARNRLCPATKSLL